MLKRIKTNKKKGFTLIELIVVMAVLAVLVLLAAPKFLGKTEQAKLTQIQNDIRVAEDKLNAVLAGKPDALKAWEPAEVAELTELVSENKLMGRGGPTLGLPTGDVWVIDDAFLDTEVRTKLTGDFFVDADGNVFYEHSKPVAPGKTETPPEKEEKPLTYEEWLAKVQAEGYVLATDADFSGETDGAFKYIGSDKLVIVPNVIKGVDVTSYKNMFEKTYAEGVASYNPNITDMSWMFYYSYAPTLDVSRLNTTGVTDMSDMFEYSQATTLDLSSFDTSQVTTMYAMFYRSQATTLDLSGFGTANVTDMRFMFSSSKATTLDLSSFDTAKVTDMYNMFSNSQATTGIARTTKDANRFNSSSSNKPTGLTFTVPEQPVNYILATDADFTGTENGTFRYNGANHYVIMPDTIKGVTVTSYKSMFEKSDVRGVISDNPNITNMAFMFYNSYAPTLDVSRLNTTGVTDMSDMFNVSQATTLDLSGFDTSQVTTMYGMFYRSQATTLDLSGFDTSQVTDMSWMFASSKATTLDLSSFDTAKVPGMTSMFNGSNATVGIARTTKDANRFKNSSNKPSGLTFTVPEQPVNYILATDADFTGTENGTFRYNGTNHYVIMPDTIKGVTVTSYKNMFEYSDVRGVISDNPNITDMSRMFYYSYAPTLDVSRLNTTNVTSMSYMFYNSQATTLDLSSFDTSQVTNMSDMFRDSKATTLDLSSFDTAKVTDMNYMFNGSKAPTLDLSSFDTAKVTDVRRMFYRSQATTGIARTTSDANRFNNSSDKPDGLTFTVKQ